MIFTAALSLVCLSGCGAARVNSATAFMMDTVVNIEAECEKGIIDDTLNFCREYEKKLSRTDTGSEVYALNNSAGSMAVSDDTAYLIRRALYFSELTGGKFDITICPVSSLWDFTGDALPDDTEIKKKLAMVGYERVSLDGNTVDLGGAQIDLGAIAKGYITDKAADYLKKQGVENAVLNFGGNVVVMGDDYYNVGIKSPSGDGLAAQLRVKNTAVVTSGTYERYIEWQGKRYHHILDPHTGYPVESDIISATVISENSTDADALSTCCLLLGLDDATALINGIEGVEAIFITADGEVHISNGIYSEDGYYRL